MSRIYECTQPLDMDGVAEAYFAMNETFHNEASFHPDCPDISDYKSVC